MSNARLQRMRARLAEQRADEANADALSNANDHQEEVAPAEPEESGGVHPAATALLIAGGASLVSFGVFAALSAAEKSNLESSCSPTCSDDEVGTLSTYNLVANISLVTAIAAGAAGVILLFVLKPGDDRENSVSVSPWMAPGAGGAVVRGTL